MANALYTLKTLTNQALTPRPWGNRITLPVLLPVLLVTLLILSACGGGGAAATINVNQPPPPNPCATNPFGDTCTSAADEAARDRIIERCIMIDNAGKDNCKIAVDNFPCIATPFIPECSASTSTFADYVKTAQTERRDFCEIADNAQNDLCVTSVANICKGDIFDVLCPTSTNVEQETFCRMGTNTKDVSGCSAIVQRVCDGTQSLFETLCTIDVAAQRDFCRTGTNTADDPANCNPIVMEICTNNPFDEICAGTFLVNETGRAEFCSKDNNLAIRPRDCAPLLNRYCATRAFLTTCDSQTAIRIQACSGSLAALTTAGGVPMDCRPYAEGICGFGRVGGSNPFADICKNSDISKYSAKIDDVRDAFCRDNVFHATCDIGYTTQRVAACHLNGIVTDADPRCGAIIANNCPSNSGTRNPACHTLVTPLTVATASDPVANYVATTAAEELQLGFDQSDVANLANISDFTTGEIRLSDLAGISVSDGGGDGVVFASFIDSDSNFITGTQSKQRFYAGLLSTTEFDTTLSRNVKRAEWTGRIALHAGGLIQRADFTLLVSFDGSGGTLRANDINIAGGLFIIDAEFNNNGRVYGNTSLNAATGASEGSLTGLIGEDGVVAAVISDGTDKGLGNYAGGFVASNPYIGDATVVTCGATDTPFDARCADNDDVRLMLCSTRNALAIADFTNNCLQDRDIIAAICADTGQYANPFDSVICPDNNIDVQSAFVANCGNANISLRAATCAAVTACVEDPFATGCDAAIYADRRSLTLNFCNAGNANDPQCANARMNCASSGADSNCGDLTTAYCAGAAGRTITGDTSTCPVRVTAYCVDYPLNPICEDVTENTAFDADDLKTDRETFCRMPIHANNPDCALTIVEFCDAMDNNGTSNALCRNRAHFRYNVIASVCDDPNRDMRFDNLCDNPHDYDIKRLEQCQSQTIPFSSVCGSSLSRQRYTMIRNICGTMMDDGFVGSNPSDPICAHSSSNSFTDERKCGTASFAGSEPFSPICEIDPQILIATTVLCGQGFKTEGKTGTIAINPFSAICANARLNPAPCPTCTTDMERTTNSNTVRVEAQRAFCRQDTMNNACTSTITTYCNAATGADLFDDLCDGGDYLADRITHCETAFTHAKCAADEMNISEAAAICGTADTVGTNPFNNICESETLNPIPCPKCASFAGGDAARELERVRAAARKLAREAFCREDITRIACPGTIKTFCDATTGDMIFDDMCDGTDYTDARLGYCIHPNANHAECETDANNKIALVALCGDAENTGTNPFSAACTEAFSLRIQIDALCGGGRNSQIALCTDENAIPDIDRESVTASQENFCRGNLALPACEETIENFCDYAFGADILDPLCDGNEYYQESRLTTCLNGDTNHPSCRGTAGVVATLCPTDGDGTNRHELCPLIVNHDLYTSRVSDFNESAGEGFVRPSGSYSANTVLTDAGVIDKNKVHVEDNLRTDDYDVDDDVERAIGYATDAPATLITGTTTGLDFGPLPPAETVIRNGGSSLNPFKITVTEVSNVADSTGGYALAVASIKTQNRIQTSEQATTEKKLYAGLLSGTKSDVGAPNFDNALPTGIWRATMDLIMAGGNATVTGATFDLSVDFNAQTIKTLASRTTQFSIIGANFAEPRYTASDSPVVPLFGPDGEPYYRRDSRGDEIIVARGDTYTDCYGNRLNPGSKVRLCEGGGLPDYNSARFGNKETLSVNRFGNPTIRTVSQSTTGRLTIDASFSSAGLIYGATNIETGFLKNGDFIGKRGGETVNSAGRLVGWIGNNKLVGAFASNAGSAEAYVGGFTATPTDTVTNFAKGGANGLTLTTNTNSNNAYKIAGTENGFAIATTNPLNVRNLHAGLLTGTNLGNPLLDNSMSGIWNATLNASYISAGIARSATSEFKLSVDFDAKTIKTLENRGASFILSSPEFVFPVTYTRQNGSTVTTQESSVGVITIDGRFSDTGRVSGTTHFQISNPNNAASGGGTGILSGLIGEEGLVAAFVSDAGSANPYAGGFTATWAGTDAIFTAGGTDGLTLTGTEAANADALGITSNTAYKIAGTDNGFALASENIANGAVNLYAGLLSDIDLGNPLFDNRATGIWTANLNAIILRETRDDTSRAASTVTTSVSSTFALRVDFDTRTLKTVQNSATSFAFDTGRRVLNRLGENAITSAGGVTTVNAFDEDGDPVTFTDTDSGVVTTMETITEVLTIDTHAGLPPLTDTYQSGDTRTNSVMETADTSVSNRVTRTKVVELKTGVTLTIITTYDTSGGAEQLLTQTAQTTREIPVVTVTKGAVVTTYKAGHLVEVSTNGGAAKNVLRKAPKASGRIIIDGRFTSSGVISGKTSLDYAGTSESGTLTGAIGANGAVAAFVGDADSGNTYVGGFTATAGVCTIGGSLFDKTACPDTNSAAKNLRLQLCLNGDPAAMPFATNCGSADEIAFIAGCLEDPDYDLGCNTGVVAECLNDPYAFNCRSASYTPARTAHLDTCGVATAPPNPRCVNLRLQLDNCSSASPNPTCGTLVNDYCFGGAGRAIAGKTTCVDNIRLACTTNALHPRCRDLGVFTTKETHEAHIEKQVALCDGAIASLPTGATPLDCNRLGLSFDICGTPTAIGSNPFAPICDDAMGNPYFEQAELAQALFCRHSPRIANEETVRDPRCTQLGTAANWRADAIRRTEVVVYDNDGREQIDIYTGLTVSKLEQRQLNITPANMIRQDHAHVNYIAGAKKASSATADEKKQLDLGSAPNSGNNDNTATIDNHGGLTLSTFDGNEDEGSGFAFASARFDIRNTEVNILDGTAEDRKVGGTKLYAGLLYDTDIGAPLVDIQTNAEWSGKISMIYGRGAVTNSSSSFNTNITEYETKDFTLQVSFYGSFGIIKNKTPIVAATNAIFNIDGRFTDRGVIYGKTRLANGQNAAVATGSLTGLIGAEGAVAAFISDNPNPLNPLRAAAVNFGNYAGGFVALPPASPSTATRVDFTAWRDSFASPEPTPLTRAFNAEEFASANNKPYFIQGNIAQLNASNDIDANRPVITLTLDKYFDDGNIYDGVTYLRGTGNRRYAGLLLGTDLGAPITGTTGTSAQWTGIFQNTLSITRPRLFALTVRFTADGGTLDALLSAPFVGANRNGINGMFDAKGIITGDVISGNYVGGGDCETNGLPNIAEDCFNSTNRRKAKLTGLIGAQGAVAAFITDDDTNINWAGGFVALSCADNPTAGYCTVNAKDWVDSFDGRIPDNGRNASEAGVKAITGENVFGGFVSLAIGEAAISAGSTSTPIRDRLSQNAATAIGGGAAPTASRNTPLHRPNSGNFDGVIFINGFRGDNNQAFVSILPTTDLGAPLASQPTTAEWPGFYYDSIAAPSIVPGITFDIDFSALSIGVVAGTAAGVSPPTFNLEFDHFGVITGTVTKNSIAATARGLIGTEGLVGGFVDTSPTSGNVFHGGFVADNPNN